MSGKKINRISDNDKVSVFNKETFHKRECNRFRIEPINNETEICECGYSKDVHSKEALQNESNQSEPLTKISETDAFGKLNFAQDEEEDSEENNIRYVRLDCETDVKDILKLFRLWKMETPNVIFSVVSDNDLFMDKWNDVAAMKSNAFHQDRRKTKCITLLGNEEYDITAIKSSAFDQDRRKTKCSSRFGADGNDVTAVKSNAYNQNTRKKICRSLVEVAVSANAWIITGGLNKGVDQLIGNEVKRIRANDDNNLQTVLGICNWGCLEVKRSLLNDSDGSKGYAFDSNPTRLSLNHHHTHFLLVDDGTQKKSGCEWKLRQNFELHLTTMETNDKKTDSCCPLIYILIGGSLNSLRIVHRALDEGIPVIIATETGGAADTISKELAPIDGATLENLPEISEKLFRRLDELLVAKISSTDDILARTKRQLFIEIAQLLEEAIFSEDDKRQSIDDVATLKRLSNNDLLDGIKDLIVSKQTPSDSNNASADNDESDTVKRLRDVIGQMLVANGLPSQNADRAADELEPLLLCETLANIKLVFNAVKSIRTHDRKDLMIKFKVTGSQKRSITSCIADALSKVKMNNPSGVYMLVAAWNDENFFRKLVEENWMSDHHQSVLKEMLKKGTKGTHKYIELMVSCNSKRKWLTELICPLLKEGDFNEKKLRARLLKKIFSLRKIDKDTEERSASLEGKMLFIWCIENKMPETAMLFWKRGQDCLAMALVAYRMSKKIALVDKEGYEEMNQQTQFFEQHAINLVKACYADDTQNTHDLLVGKVQYLWERTLTPLDIAENADFSSFISLAPIQDLLNKIWIKDIEDYNKFKYLPMLLSEVCPLLAPALFNIRLPSTGNRDVAKQNETAQSCKCVLEYFQRVQSFINTPFVKFTYGLVSYIGYLLLFSVVMLTDFGNQMSRLEIFLNCWTLILLIEEVKQAVVQRSEYMNIYNYFDMGAIMTYIVGFIMRMIYQYHPLFCPFCLYVARIVLAFSLLIFFIRALPFLSIYNDIGPKVFMIRRLITDLISFMLILVVFISAYGVVSNIILYPNQPLDLDLLHDVYYDASWAVLQMFNPDETSGSLCGKGNGSEIDTAAYCKSITSANVDYVWCKANRCPANQWIVSVLLVLYALFVVVMLLNVLIAMFNATFATIAEREKGVSKMQRYRLIREYSYHPMIPIPLCVVTYPYFFIKYLLSLSRERRESQHQLQTDSRDTEAQTMDTDHKQNGNPSRPSKSSPKAFEKNLDSNVEKWERAVVSKYYKETKYKKGRNSSISRIKR